MSPISVSLNARQRNIVFTLLEENSRITLDDLSQKTGLSQRVIRYNLDHVEAWFRSQSIPMVRRPGFGIEVDAPRPLRKRLIDLITNYDDQNLILSRAQRRRAILLDLLLSESPKSLQKLGSAGNISRSTLIHDISEIETWLNKHHLLLTKKTKTGLYSEGSESSRRFAIMVLLREELGEEKWQDIWANCEFKTFSDKSLPMSIENFIQKLHLEVFKGIITNIEKNIGHRLSLGGHVEALIYAAIMIDAIKKGRIVKDIPNAYIVHLVEFEVAKIFMREFEHHYQINIPEQEVNLFAAILLSAEIEIEKSENEVLGKTHHPNSIHFAEEIISICSAQLHPLLKIDKELTNGLIYHHDRSLYRLRYGIPIINPLLDSIMNLYPEIFFSARLSVKVIEQEMRLLVPDEEVGFIAMHLAAGLDRLRTNRLINRKVILIGDGECSKTTLLKARLEYEFLNLQVSDVLNADDSTKIASCNADILISLVPMEHPQIPVILVSPFLVAKEVKNIQSCLTKIEEHERRKVYSGDRKPTIVDLLEPANINFARSENEWKKIVTMASEPLIQSHKIEPNYIDAMIKIIEENGPYMILVPGVILLHARPTDGVNTLCLSLLLIENGTFFSKNETGEVHIVFVLGAVDGQSHLTALSQLAELIKNSEFIESLKKSTSSAEVLRNIWSHLLFKSTEKQTSHKS